MKFDKDTIIKNHFWILVGLAGLLALIGWVLLLLGAPGTVVGQAAEIESKWNTNKKHSTFVHADFIELKRKEASMLKAQRSQLQGQLYEEQMKATTLMTWPREMEKTFDLRRGKYAMGLDLHGDKKVDLPADDATRISGKLTKTESWWFQVLDREDKTITFLRTDKPAKAITWGDIALNIGKPVTVTFIEGKRFGEELTVGEKHAYHDAYDEQLFEVLKELRPVNELGQPIVHLRYPKKVPDSAKSDPKKDKEPEFINDVWIYSPKKRLPPPDRDNRFFPYVQKWWTGDNDILSEEIWTAQEAIWIQREMFKQIKAANDSLAICQKVKSSPDGKSATYQGYYWTLDLKLTDKGVETRLTNRRSKPQVTDGLRFLVRFKSGEETREPLIFPPREAGFDSFTVGPSGGGADVFPADGPAVLGKDPKLTSFDQVESVEQLITVETAAVKRLDVLAVGSSVVGDMTISHATAYQRPMPYKRGTQLQIKVSTDPYDPTAKGPDLTIKRTKHQLVLECYTEVKPEFRKVPILMVVIVSPEHVNLVQSHLIGSPLRFFPTQVLWHRDYVLLNAVPGPADLALGGGGDSYAECVELSIYGVVTIYEQPGGGPK